jgi:hypothetical protein
MTFCTQKKKKNKTNNIGTHVEPSVFSFEGGQNFTKFRPEKYDFDLYTKDFPWEKWLKFTRFQRGIFFFPKSSDFGDKFPAGRQECRRILGVFFFLFFFLFSFPYFLI